MKAIIARLEEMGLEVIQSSRFYRIYKPVGKAGNRIEGKQFQVVLMMDEKFENWTEIFSDCPVLVWHPLEEKVLLECWEWVPGPGPGDFQLEMEEAEALEFVARFFFGENSYFEAKKAYWAKEK